MKQEIFKKIVELADGFSWIDRDNGDYEVYLPEDFIFLCSWCNHFRTNRWKQIYYPLLLRRAVEGWPDNLYDLIYTQDYQKTDYLTSQEQAMEACLIELLENKNDLV